MFFNIAYDIMGGGASAPDDLIQETSKTMQIIQIAFLIITALVVIGFIFAIIYSCKKNKLNELDEETKKDEEEHE